MLGKTLNMTTEQKYKLLPFHKHRTLRTRSVPLYIIATNTGRSVPPRSYELFGYYLRWAFVWCQHWHGYWRCHGRGSCIFLVFARSSRCPAIIITRFGNGANGCRCRRCGVRGRSATPDHAWWWAGLRVGICHSCCFRASKRTGPCSSAELLCGTDPHK